MHIFDFAGYWFLAAGVISHIRWICKKLKPKPKGLGVEEGSKYMTDFYKMDRNV